MGLLDIFRRKSRAASTVSEDAPMLADLSGDGGFALAVVGESFYRENFDRVCGKKDDGADNLIVAAVLVCEADNLHDPNAVRVDVAGLPWATSRARWRRNTGHGLLRLHLMSGPARAAAWSVADGIAVAMTEASMGIRLDLDLTKGRRRPDT